jgi:dipeptidyl aminopeptidase/acylaminoacyl peptidase
MTPRPLTPEDVLTFKNLLDVQISPDGALIAFVVGDPFKEDAKSEKYQIWVVPTAGGEARPFTTGPRADTTPRWSPDGHTLAFLSDRLEDGKPQIYLLDRTGGEARKLTDMPEAVSDIAWSPDGTQLAFLMNDPETEADRQRKTEQGDAIEVEKNHRWRRVWAVDVTSGATRQVTGDAQVWEFDWAPDGGFALIVGPEPYEWAWYVSRLARVGPAGGAAQTIYSIPEKQFGCPRLSPDGTQLAFLSCIWSDRGNNEGGVFVMPAAGGEPRNLTADYGGSVGWVRWTPDGAALDYLAYEDGEAAIGQIDVTSGARSMRWRGPVELSVNYGGSYVCAINGLVAVARQDAEHPTEIWLAQEPRTEDQEPRTDERQPDLYGGPSVAAPVATPDAQALHWRQLTRTQPPTDGLALGETRVLRWHATDSLAIQGLLILPAGYQEGQRVPTITWVHGGPAGLYPQGFNAAGRGLQLFAGAGYAVFMPNPRGSTGWGVDFTEANIGDLGGRDFEDIVAGLDHVIALGIADPQRLGIGGWSYGGFMTAWAVTQTNRFKAAIAGAPITHWRSFHGIAEIGTWDAISYRASPYAAGGPYDHFSPIHYVSNVQTPTLLIHGQDDIIVPVSQSYEFFRALKDRGVPTELVVYPREPHGPRERAHKLDRLRRFREWFDRYLG